MSPARLASSALAAFCMTAATAVSAEAERHETVAYVNGKWFDGKDFTEARKVTVRGVFINEDAPADRTVDLDGAYVIPPFGDAHTHEFDGPWSFASQNAFHLKAGTFYAMTMTAPTSGVAQIRARFADWDTVDVATSLGGLTGPSSHPAEIYEAVAMRIYSSDEQIARQEEIRASTRAQGDAYWVVEDEASLNKAWRELLLANPDVIKVFLRHSAQYAERNDKSWAIGGVDPAMLPAIGERAKSAGIRLAVAASDISDLRAALDVGAEIVTHIPCYQDTSEPGLYFYPDSDENCLLTAEDATRAARQGVAMTVIASEFAKEQTPHVRQRVETNVRKLQEAGAPIVIGSNAYGKAVREGVIAEAGRDLFTPAELLRIATMVTPRTIFPGRDVGCVDAGCEASFLVLAENPIETPNALSQFELLVKRGRELQFPDPE